MLSEKFDDLLVRIGNPKLEHPIFYHAPIGIRFKIGSEIPVYLNSAPLDNRIVNPKYVASALQRAKAIYTALSHAPNLLRIDTYPQENELGYGGGLDLDTFQRLLPFPHEQRAKQVNDHNEQYTVLQLYWDLYKADFSPDILLSEIIKADLGGISALVSSVYFANTEDVYLYHVYDDRAADLVAENKEMLRPLYHDFNQWILDYDREQIYNLFAK